MTRQSSAISLDLFADPAGVADVIATPFSEPSSAAALRDMAARVGLDRLTETETLELLIARSAVSEPHELARRLLRRYSSLRAVLGADLPGLARVLGPDAAVDLQLVYEAARRLAWEELPKRSLLSSWSMLFSYLKLTMSHCEREAFRVLFLDKKNQLVADEIMGHGTVDHAPVYPREVMRRALELSASALILVHNHPSGDPAPSSADVEMTRRIVEAGTALGIVIHDHVIVGRQDVASLKALGLF